MNPGNVCLPTDSAEPASSPARRGLLFVVSGPSGVGKDTLLDRLLERVSGVVRSVSATTRTPRPGEIHGVDYFFLTRSEFETGIAQDLFLEYAPYGENLYGTPRQEVARLLERGLDVILKIEVKGALLVRRLAPEAILIFIQPPSLQELERRLRARGTDSEDRIAARLDIARTELVCIPQYDYLVTNDDLEAAVDALRSIILAERCRIRHGS
ncbi:MAG TPA: guanylate kinase [Chthonomonadaceae bacterium]|nr:guanylate kinase [Chthonomonadaceae bacterium]